MPKFTFQIEHPEYGRDSTCSEVTSMPMEGSVSLEAESLTEVMEGFLMFLKMCGFNIDRNDQLAVVNIEEELA
jgi:hypothetical protein